MSQTLEDHALSLDNFSLTEFGRSFLALPEGKQAQALCQYQRDYLDVVDGPTISVKLPALLRSMTTVDDH